MKPEDAPTRVGYYWVVTYNMSGGFSEPGISYWDGEHFDYEDSVDRPGFDIGDVYKLGPYIAVPENF
jgi:hypothetical protein